MIVIYDLETLKNFFLYIDLELSTGEFNIFECSKFKNEISDLVKHLKKVKGQIGFNNLAFDSQVQEFVLRTHFQWEGLSGEDIATIIYRKSQYVIEKANSDRFPDYWERDIKIRQLDLYRIWHYNNKSRMCSLKWVQYSIDWHNIEDMPINHYDNIDDREVADKVIGYCKNDCLSTRAFYDISRGNTEFKLYKEIDKIQLRNDIKSEFGIDCHNFDDVKIGDEINKVNYLNSTGLSRRELKELRVKILPFKFRDCFPSYIKFETDEFNAFISRISDEYVDLNSKQEFKFRFGITEYTLAKGGLHSNDKPRTVIPNLNQILRDADVGSMYPNAIHKRKLYPRHLGEKWLDGYLNTIEKRLKAKKAYKETKEKKYKAIDEALKYSLNGGSFGKTQDKTNWQFDPFITFCVTIGCQIDLLMLIEMLELSDIKVISANTDGVVCLFDKIQEDQYYKTCKTWEKLVGNEGNAALEYTDYATFAQRSVNDYMAVKTNGEIKHKGGSFTIHHELHKNKSYRIIPLALNEFFSKGVAPSGFIINHENIFDFCAGMRTRGEWWLESRGFIKGDLIKSRLQKTNRYYISKNGFKLIKCNPDGREIQEDAGKWLATVYNKHEQKPITEYDINYDFYIKKTYEIINEIQPEIINSDYTQLSLF